MRNRLYNTHDKALGVDGAYSAELVLEYEGGTVQISGENLS